jgi:hypothetical protein
VDFGKAVLLTLDAMAADTHGGFFLARLGITRDALGLCGQTSGGQGRSGDKGTNDGGQQLVHFASTMGWTLIKINR